MYNKITSSLSGFSLKTANDQSVFVGCAQPDTADEMFRISLKYHSQVWTVSGSKSQRELNGHSAVSLSRKLAFKCTVIPLALIHVHVSLQKTSKIYLIDERNIFNRLLNIYIVASAYYFQQ